MAYRCEAASVEGFVQQLACNLISKGYWFYVTGRVPERQDPEAVDEKLIRLYGLDISKWARARRKARGHANVAYLRHERFFVLLATQGAHLLFEREGYVRDVRRAPILFHGYSIGCGRGSDGHHHSSVKISADAFAELQAHLMNMAKHRSAATVAAEFREIRFIPFARVRRQLLRLLGEVNSARRASGYSLIPISALRLRRTIYRPFVEKTVESSGEAACDDSARDQLLRF